jgi:hypothetical protein
MVKGTLALAALGISWGLPPLAHAAPAKQYLLKHPAHEHCKAHYANRVEAVNRRVHHKTVKVDETFCVYLAPKPPARHVPAPVGRVPTAPAETLAPALPSAPVIATAPSQTILHAHLDPTFVQNPTNPLAVTYSYSASAAEELSGVVRPDPNLPSGILNLYSDGLLECSINVGGSVTGGECPVDYSWTGAHTIIVTYTSESLSATETVTENIELFKTTTTLSVVPSTCSVSSDKESCSYILISATVDQSGNPVESPSSLSFRLSAITPAGELSVDNVTTEESSVLEVGLEKGLTEWQPYLHLNGNQLWPPLLLGVDEVVKGITGWSVIAFYQGSLRWSESRSAPQMVSP